MKKNILPFIMVFIGQFLSAQAPTELEIHKSDRFEEKNKANDINVLCKLDNGNLFTLRFGKKYCIADLMNDKLEFITKVTIKKGKKEAYKGHVRLGDKVKVFTVDATDKSERIINCYIFDLLNGSYEKRQLVRLPIIRGKTFFKDEHSIQTGFDISGNNRYVAIAMGSAKRKKCHFYMYVFDSDNLKTIYKNKYEENDTLGFEPKGILVDNEGSIFLLKKVWIHTDAYAFTSDDEIENYQFQLQSLHEVDTKTIKIASEGKFIKSLRMRSVNNTIQLLGCYADKGYDRIEGTCTFTVNKADLTVKSSKTNIFTKKIFEDVFNSDENPWLLGFSIDRIIENKNGVAHMILVKTKPSEDFFNNFDNSPFMFQTDGSFKLTLLILKVNPSGELVWGRGIYKLSEHYDFNAFVKNEKLHLLLNSGEKVLNNPEKKVIFKERSLGFTALYDVVYDTDGNVTYHKVHNNESQKFYMPISGLFADGYFLVSNKDRFDRKYMLLN